MIKVPSRNKKHLIAEIKKFKPLVRSLMSRGKDSSEDDARILLNDILHESLGYDKYSELRTEHREKANRLDYAVKLNEGKNKNKPEMFDFLIEAKAVHVSLSDIHVDQTLSYCLGLNVRFFVVTNAKDWKLYYVNKRKKIPEAELVYQFSFSSNHSDEDLAEELYVFSRDCFLSGQWKEIRDKKDALDTENVMAILLSDKVARLVSKELKELTGMKVELDIIKSVIEKKIAGQEVQGVNKKFLKKIDEKPSRKRKQGNGSEDLPPSLENIPQFDSFACVDEGTQKEGGSVVLEDSEDKAS